MWASPKLFLFVIAASARALKYLERAELFEAAKPFQRRFKAYFFASAFLVMVSYGSFMAFLNSFIVFSS